MVNGSHLMVAVSISVALWCESRGSHVGTSYCLDFSDAPELVSV